MRTMIVDSQNSIVVVRANQQRTASELWTLKSKCYNDAKKFVDVNIVAVVIQNGRRKGNMETLMLEMIPSPSGTSICEQSIR